MIAQGLALRFLVYDVDGEPNQSEAVRIAKNSGLVGYQLGNTAQRLTASEDANSYLFTGPGTNFPEQDASGAAIFYFENTNSFTFRFEANTLASSPANNGVFSAIDGDLSFFGASEAVKQSIIDRDYSPIVSTRPARIPEPFTIIGTIIGGTAAVRMRKKLKADKSA